MNPLYIAYLCSLSFSCIQMVLYTTIPYISETTEVSTQSIIGAISVGSFIFAFMGPFWAAKSDSWGRTRVLSLGMLGMAISFALLSALFIFNSSLPIEVKILFIFLCRIVYGLLCSAIVPVSQALQLDIIRGEEHTKVLTKNSMCLNLGRILGPVLILFKQVDFELVIYYSSIWVFILAVVVFLLPTQKGLAISKGTNFEFSVLFNSFHKSIKESFYPIMLALVFTAFVGILYSFLGVHIKSVLNISGKEASLMFAKVILVLSVLAVFYQQISILMFKSSWRPRILIGSSSLLLGTYLMMYASSENMMWLSIVFIALATALIPPAYLSLTSRSEENTKTKNVFGKKLGLASISHSLGYAVGTGLIALSMKWALVPEELMVLIVSIILVVLSVRMLFFKSMAFNLVKESDID